MNFRIFSFWAHRVMYKFYDNVLFFFFFSFSWNKLTGSSGAPIFIWYDILKKS